MSNLSVSRVSFGENLITQQAAKSVTTEPKSENNKLSENAKIMIGLGALSTVVLGSLLAHKCIKLNKLVKDNEQLNKLCTDYKKDFINAYESCISSGTECKTAGKTIEESIANIYGKDCNIKPHTYDKSKEYLIRTLEYGSGYGHTVIAPNNRFMVTPLDPNTGTKWTIVKDVNTKNCEICITEGINKYGQRLVGITFPERMQKSIINQILIISKNNNYTPAQKDILKLKDKNFSGKEKCMLQALTTPELDENLEILHKGNFDAILSVIQHLANG